MHHTESRSVHNPSTGVQSETNCSDNTQTISSLTSLTLMASYILRRLYKNTSLPAFFVWSLLLKFIIVTQFSLVHLLQKYYLHA